MKRSEQAMFTDQDALVLGAGLSGTAAARLLAANGCRVDIVDAAEATSHADLTADLDKTGIKIIRAAHELPNTKYGFCVSSPGIPLSHPWLKACGKRGIPVIGELELGYRFWPGKILAITGSKGKSSATKLAADTLTLAGKTAVAAGNYGVPLSDCVLKYPSHEWAVVETSSFQLELTEKFRPEIGILLNIQSDHLDRHGTLERYAALKYRLFEAQYAGDLAILPIGSPIEPTAKMAARKLYFGHGTGDWQFQAGRITSHTNSSPPLDINGSWFDNTVTGPAAAAVAAALIAIGVATDTIETGFRGFTPLPHRMQSLGRYGGVKYVDDSKATSLSATRAALLMSSGPIRLIAGGRLKEYNLNTIKELMTKRVKKVYLIGESAQSLLEAWHQSVPCVESGTLAAAIEAAYGDSAPGETVLLSPGCASFDQFENYAERGTAFARHIATLADSLKLSHEEE